MSPESELDDIEFSWQQEMALCGLIGLAMIAGSLFAATFMYGAGRVTIISGLLAALAAFGVIRTLRKTRGG